ncbi:MAG: class I SAM-dependent methyltransferase [Crocosphaera sp.]
MSNSTLENLKTEAIQLAKTVDGYMADIELQWLYDNAYGNTVEIGCYKGKSTTAIGLKLKQSEGNLTCVDCWYNEEVFNEFQNTIKRANIPVSMLKIRSVEAASHFPDNSLDFVFLDSSHEYQDTIEEILLWLPKLKADGLLSGHDYGHRLFPGLTQAVDELCFGFENPVKSIWTLQINKIPTEYSTVLKKLGEYQKQILSLQQQCNQAVVLQDETVQKWQQCDHELVGLRQEIQQKESEKSALLNQVKILQQNDTQLQQYQQEITQLKAEIEAMKTSKFWQLRSLWFKLKQTLG